MTGQVPRPTAVRLLDLADNALDAGERAMLCTVVDLEGSGYARPGSRLVIVSDGQRAGFVSGGCLERELMRLAWPATARGPATLTFDTRGNPTQLGGRYNAGCEGCIHILCEPLDSDSLALRSLRMRVEGTPQTTAVVLASDDPAIAVGLRRDETEPGPLGFAFDSLVESAAASVTVSRAGVAVFAERCDPPPRLVIFGAGDDAIPLAAMASQLGRQVVVVASRPERLTRARFPSVERVIATAEEVCDRIALSADDAAVLMTHSFADDAALLPTVLASSASYVGLLGPKRRAARLMTELHARGELPSPSHLDRLRSPIGLDLGAAGPEEIAVSILAEIVAASHGRDGQPLRDRSTPINTPHRRIAIPAPPSSVPA